MTTQDKPSLEHPDLFPFFNVCEQLKKSTQHKTIPPLLYRGQANSDWDLDSSLYRQLSTKTTPTPIELSEEVTLLLTQAKKRKNSHLNIKNISNYDFELLAEIQHMGGKTPLIDFSYSALIALYFACQSCEIEEKEKDGIIFIIYPYENNDLKILDIQNKYTWGDVFKTAKIELFSWEPPQINDRIIKQDSVFIFNKQGIITDPRTTSLIIKANEKQLIKQALQQLFNINDNAIYPDFLGYIQGNNYYG